NDGERRAEVLPDLATCPECLAEIRDPSNRRYRYPFTNCTHCGPRFSIMHALPYDRAETTMRGFQQCAECLREYSDPDNRRFHAQPNACPACGPQLALVAADGRRLAERDDALASAVRALAAGRIVAVKGLGGFHLMVDAGSQAAVQRLRLRKHRPEKPFAVMFPDVSVLRAHCVVGEDAEVLLSSAAAPIVVLPRRESGGLAAAVAPENPNIGAMLAYTPLHHLLLGDLGRPVVATSGNVSNEPICIDETDAVARLGDIADVFLVHDRPIARPVEDAVTQIAGGRPMLLRPGRGQAPLRLPLTAAEPSLGAGAHMKVALAMAGPGGAVLGPHIGDLDTPHARVAWRRQAESLERLYRLRPRCAGVDAHPDYPSRAMALSMGVPVTDVQHHHAHAVAAMAEHGLEGPVLAVVWDGTGAGPDGTVWGGELLQCTLTDYRRLGHLRPFPLPGGDNAVREPRRAAVGLLYEMGAPWMTRADDLGFDAASLAGLKAMVSSRLNSPLTSSAGRLFDAVGALIGGRASAGFDGQAAMAVQFAAERAPPDEPESTPALALDRRGGMLTLDWGDMVADLLEARARGELMTVLARRFHRALARGIAAAVGELGGGTVILAGGCFQNALLLELTRRELVAGGIRVLWPSRVPVNDGGIGLGQAVVASRRGRNVPAGTSEEEGE
ncbi:MAG: carbamoyltransferase HypF, partial [Ectothiorhodospiraceae bacterium]